MTEEQKRAFNETLDTLVKAHISLAITRVIPRRRRQAQLLRRVALELERRLEELAKTP